MKQSLGNGCRDHPAYKGKMATRKKKAKVQKVPKSTQSSRDKAREARLRKIFNITSEEYEQVLEHQNGLCPITLRQPSSFYLDHRHSDGLLRGLLSMRANKGLGFFNDDPEQLRRAADYLENSIFTEVLGEPVYGMIGRVTKRAKNRRYGPEGSKEPQPRAALNKIKETKPS